MASIRNKYRQKGFQEVHTLSEFVNIPRVVNRARQNELRRFGITPLNYSKWAPQPTRKQMTPNQIRKFEANLARSLEYNNNNTNINLSENYNGKRKFSAASDPKVNSRSSSPGLKGGRKTRKQRQTRTQKHKQSRSRKHSHSHSRKH